MMEINLKDRTALVTGATAGIGRGIAVALAAAGARSAIVGRRESLLNEVAEEIEAAGGIRPAIIAADLMDPDAPRDIRKRAQKALGQINILANSAGASRPMTIDASDAEWDEAMTLNFTRQRQLTHEVLPEMVSGKWGRIINITGKSEPKRVNGAMAAKAAMHMWSKGLSLEVGKHAITINSISPGYILSEQIQRMYTPKDLKRLADEVIPAGYVGVPADIAALVAFLSSDHGRYISGTVIPVDGALRSYAF